MTARIEAQVAGCSPQVAGQVAGVVAGCFLAACLGGAAKLQALRAPCVRVGACAGAGERGPAGAPARVRTHEHTPLQHAEKCGESTTYGPQLALQALALGPQPLQPGAAA